MVNRPASPSPVPLQRSASGWSSPLTWSVLAGITLESVTGLWILMAPFSLATQFQVILHVIGGLLLLGPYAIYQVRHWREWRSQTFSVASLLGYAALALTLVCLSSGLVVTAQAWFGRRVSPLWDQVHLATGLATATVVLVHLAAAWLRRAAPLRQLAGFVAILRRRALFLFGVLAGVYAVLGLTVSVFPQLPVHLPIPTDYTLPAHAQQFDEYRGNPFAPTYARTAGNEFINPDVLAHSASCGTIGCHEEILAEWEPSAHRFSAMNPPFQAVQKNFAAERSAADTRYCAGCHDPISLFAGAKDIHNLSLSAPGMQEGASCAVCHSISHVDQRGNADYVLTPPKKYLGEHAAGLAKRVSDFLIRAYPRQHLLDYDRNILRTPEFCGACHKQFIPEALNRFGASPSQNQFDEWRKSHWFDENNSDQSLSCRDCHMRLVPGSRDPGAGEAGDQRRTADDGAHRHHGTIGTNFFMSEVLKLPHWEKHRELTEAWIKGETVLPEIAHLWPAGPVAPIEIVAPAIAPRGAPLDLEVVVRNRKIGHNFVTGPLDFLRAWVHLTVHDATGAVIAEFGGIDPLTRRIQDEPGVEHRPGRPRDEGTFVLEGVPLDEDGQPLLRHELWRKAGGSGNRTIFPRYADKQTYRIDVPTNTPGPLTVTARLNFRRYRQEFLDLVLPEMERDSGVLQPTVTKDTAVHHIALDEPADASPALVP